MYMETGLEGRWQGDMWEHSLSHHLQERRKLKFRKSERWPDSAELCLVVGQHSTRTLWLSVGVRSDHQCVNMEIAGHTQHLPVLLFTLFVGDKVSHWTWSSLFQYSHWPVWLQSLLLSAPRTGFIGMLSTNPVVYGGEGRDSNLLFM